MTKAAIGAGNVEIDLDGETVVLRPTLKAAQTISRQAGGIRKAIDALGNFDIDVMTSIITLGMDLTGREAKDVADKVWRTGMADLTVPVIQYLTILANGGRPVDATGGEGTEDPQDR
jgi:hypothetical protein